MKKIFFIITISFFYFTGCNEEISSPDNPPKEIQITSKTNNFIDSLFSIKQINLYDYLGNFGGTIHSDPHAILTLNAAKVKVATNFYVGGMDVGSNAIDDGSVGTGQFQVDSWGRIMIVSGIEASKSKLSIITSDGLSFTPKRMAMWRGELYEDPEDGVSGDRYYNLTIDKEKVYIEARSKWIVSN